jgi:hypothetical protein
MENHQSRNQKRNSFWSVLRPSKLFSPREEPYLQNGK